MSWQQKFNSRLNTIYKNRCVCNIDVFCAFVLKIPFNLHEIESNHDYLFPCECRCCFSLHPYVVALYLNLPITPTFNRLIPNKWYTSSEYFTTTNGSRRGQSVSSNYHIKQRPLNHISAFQINPHSFQRIKWWLMVLTKWKSLSTFNDLPSLFDNFRRSVLSRQQIRWCNVMQKCVTNVIET